MADPRPHETASTPGFDDWRGRVASDLKGRDFSALRSLTRDGIVIEPLYQARTDRGPLPGRGERPWSIVQIVDDPDPERANRQALEDLAGGATGLAIRFSGAPSAHGFGLPADETALRLALEGIDLAAIHLRIDPHPNAATAALWVRDLVLKQGVAPERAHVAFGLDPLGAAVQGVGIDPAIWTKAFQALAEASFRGAIVSLDARPYHEAGASEAQELATLLAGIVWWLRALQPLGIAPGAALPLFGASLAVDRDQFLSIAKLRALQLVWARMSELCGVAPAHLPVHAETSRRMMIRADPHSNLLRTTIAAFAAGAGGADSIAVLPHDAALGLSGRDARALARNMQHLLIEETQLHRVGDPAAGSGAVEALTDALAEGAWAEFQATEREGGILESLRSGALPERIAKAREALAAEVAAGAVPFVGATIHRPPHAGNVVDERDAAGPVPALAPIRLEALAREAA